MSTNLENMYAEYMMPNYTPSNLIPTKAEGSKVWDQNNNEFIDFSAGIAVTSLGHSNPNLNRVLKSQSEKIWHLSNIFTFEPTLYCAKALIESSFADKAFFANSGAEANEAAFKLARRYAYENYGEEKNQIISFKQGFHGRTFFTVSVGGQEKYSSGFGPNPGAIDHIEYNSIEAIEKLINKNTCAVVIELIQGEGGVIVADKEFVKKVRSLCNDFNALLVIDEVQTGIGRTGSLYAYEQFDITPDIMTLAKALGNGFPVAAMLTTNKVAKHLSFGSHGSTYGGNPLACSIALEVLNTINQKGFLEGVQKRSEIIFSRLEEINSEFNIFKEIRGKGLLIGAELNTKFKGRAGEFFSALQKNGLLVLVAGPDVLRFTPALNIPLEDLEAGFKLVETTIKEVLNS